MVKMRVRKGKGRQGSHYKDRLLSRGAEGAFSEAVFMLMVMVCLSYTTTDSIRANTTGIRYECSIHIVAVFT